MTQEEVDRLYNKPVLTTVEVASLLGVTRQAIDDKVITNVLHPLENTENRYRKFKTGSILRYANELRVDRRNRIDNIHVPENMPDRIKVRDAARIMGVTTKAIREKMYRKTLSLVYGNVGLVGDLRRSGAKNIIWVDSREFLKHVQECRNRWLSEISRIKLPTRVLRKLG
jgi:hypothetical protein